MDGGGAYRYGARWNSPGRHAIYAAASYAGALLEILAHVNTGKLPKDLVWIRITIPQEIKIREADEQIPWNSADYVENREFGDQWLETRSSALLLVPSVVMAGIERNVVINPDHEEFRQLSVTDPRPVIWDQRLFSTRSR